MHALRETAVRDCLVLKTEMITESIEAGYMKA